MAPGAEMTAPARNGRPPSLQRAIQRLARQHGDKWLETVDRAARLGDAQAAAWLADRALEQQNQRQQNPGS